MLISDTKESANQPLLPKPSTYTRARDTTSLQTRKSRGSRFVIHIITLSALILCLLAWFNKSSSPAAGDVDLSSNFLERCAWRKLQGHASLLDVPRITRDEYLQRQAKLAAALDKAGVDAFVAEPSASSSYYANISESFELSERPFLMILDKSAQFSYLAPKFELGRIARLSMIYDTKKVIEWPEEQSPYEVFRTKTGYAKVMLDEHVRYMIAAGLEAAGVEVVPMSEEIQALRAVKTEAEIVILRAINTFTLELIRSLQQCLVAGMTQEMVFTAGSNLFGRAGVGEGYWAIILFGDQAAYPRN